jgi:hypothetical protein
MQKTSSLCLARRQTPQKLFLGDGEKLGGRKEENVNGYNSTQCPSRDLSNDSLLAKNSNLQSGVNLAHATVHFDAQTV